MLRAIQNLPSAPSQPPTGHPRVSHGPDSHGPDSYGPDSRVPTTPIEVSHLEPARPTAAETSDHAAPFALWEGPTLRELADRVEHQFGCVSSLSGLESLGFGHDEPLAPCDVDLVCDLLGLPAADFGLDV